MIRKLRDIAVSHERPVSTETLLQWILLDHAGPRLVYRSSMFADGCRTLEDRNG
jgi:hypothetical protein